MPASLYTHIARYCDPADCDLHDRARLHRVKLEEPWRLQLRAPKPRKQRTVAPMDNDARAARYLAQTGRWRLTGRQLRQMRRMDRRQLAGSR